MFTTKSLYSQVLDLIIAKSGSIATTASQVLSSSSSADLASIVNTATTDDVLSAISDILANIVEARIISGLEVTQTDPVSNSITINAGTGTAFGKYYTLDTPITIQAPFTSGNGIYFVNLYSRGIVIEKRSTTNGLTIAKIITTSSNAYQYIYDNRDDAGNAYIQCFKSYNLYGINDKFEEDTLELLRDNIGTILADNIIGNIRLSENLKITNTSGTLELNSDSLYFKDYNGTVLTKLNPTGIYFNRADGVELAKFSTSGARIGNIIISPNSLSSGNYSPSVSGFSISDSGDVEFNDIVARGTIYANAGQIGGFTIADNYLYATTTGTIKTSGTAGSGSNGVVLDKDGLRGYNATLGTVFNLPTDGSAPTFASGIINSTLFNLTSSSVIRTSDTVGDGTSISYGLLMNDTGLYGCGANQTLTDANFKILADGTAYFKGQINASSGIIGSTTITETSLTGGLITGSEIISAIIETSSSYPRIRIDNDGVSYQVTASTGKYGEFLYGDGTLYGAGVLAYLFNPAYPAFAVVSETTFADIRLFNRSSDPASGSHELGDLICVSGALKVCSVSGTPGTFVAVGSGTVTSTSVVSANGFAGSVATSTTTPAITITTTVTGIVKGNGTALSTATAGTDYSVPTGTETLTNKTLTSPVISTITGPTSFTGQYNSTKYTCTVTLDWNNSNVQYITLTNGGQTFTFANPKDGARYVLIVKQPASGAAGTVTWPGTVLWAGGTTPTLTTTNSKVDIISFVYDGTNTKYYGGSNLNY